VALIFALWAAVALVGMSGMLHNHEANAFAEPDSLLCNFKYLRVQFGGNGGK